MMEDVWSDWDMEGEVGIKGDCWEMVCWMYVGLCSNRCKLKEVVCPFGKCGDWVYKRMREKVGEDVCCDGVMQKVMDY